MKAIEKAGYRPGEQVAIALDCASSELFDEGGRKGYKFWKTNPDKLFTADELIELYTKWVGKYPIISIEDGLDQNDWEGYVKLTKALGNKIQIMGDDFFVTNTKRLEKGIAMGACNSILIKLNQIGTVTETIEAITMAKRAGYTAVVSHRSGETEDAFIADLTVAMKPGKSKPAPCPAPTASASTTSSCASRTNGSIAEYWGKKVFYNVHG
jgi:enolase